MTAIYLDYILPIRVRLGPTIAHPRAPRLKPRAAHHAASYPLLHSHWADTTVRGQRRGRLQIRFRRLQSLAFRPCALSPQSTAAVLSLLNCSDRPRPPWPQRRTLLKARSMPLPHLLQTCHSVLHTTLPSLTVAIRFPRSHVDKTLDYAPYRPRAAYEYSGRPTSTASNPGDTSPLTPARLKRGHNNGTHTPHLQLRHSHDTKPRLTYYS